MGCETGSGHSLLALFLDLGITASEPGHRRSPLAIAFGPSTIGPEEDARRSPVPRGVAAIKLGPATPGCYHSPMTAALVPPELLDPVVAYFQPRRVIVFGSVARGEAGPDSDIDLLVVLDDDAPAEKLTLKAGYESRKSYVHPTDIFPCREQTYRRKCQIVGTLPYAARTEGIVVYERP